MKKFMAVITIITLSFAIGVHYGFSQGKNTAFAREMMWAGVQAVYDHKHLNSDINQLKSRLTARVDLGIKGYIDYQDNVNSFLAELYLQPLSGSLKEDHEKFISYLIDFQEQHPYPSTNIEDLRSEKERAYYQQRTKRVERIKERVIGQNLP